VPERGAVRARAWTRARVASRVAFRRHFR
jgi:hypothetical protein